MYSRMMSRIENREQNQSGSTNCRKHNRKCRENLLTTTSIGHESSVVSQPALRGKGQVQKDGGDAAAGDEEGLEGRSADVADVGNVLFLGH